MHLLHKLRFILLQEKDCELIPILLGDVAPPVDNLQYIKSELEDKGVLHDTATKLCTWLKGGGDCSLLSPVPVSCVILFV